MELRKTSLYQKHLVHKAKIVDFDGWALPIEYESILKEAKVTRATCGIFDASHMGEIYLSGKSSFEFLQKLSSNDISLTREGQLQYNLFLNEAAGIIDDFMAYNLGKKILCVVNASNTQKVYNWLLKHKISGVEINDASEETSLICLQGPKSSVIIGRIFTLPFESFKYMHFTKTVFSNEEIIISRSGYTAEDGFEIYSSNRLAEKIWDVLFETGSPYGLKPCGLGARDVLRIEAGYPLYGHEINDEINPLQACLGWAVKLNKNFISRDKLLKIKQNGLRRKRVGFTMTERAVPRQGYRVYSSTGEAGYVTSGTYSPNLERFIGMAYIDNGLAKPATPITIEIRDKQYRAETADFNFIRRR